MQSLLLLIAVSIGVAIAFVDTRPGWDDTGITAMAIFGSCSVLSMIAPGRTCLWALAVGVWVPLTAIATTQNYGSILALILAFAGACSGTIIRRVLASDKDAAGTANNSSSS